MSGHWKSTALAAAAIASVAALIWLLSTDDGPQDARSARSECAQNYEVIRSRSYSPEATARATDARFRVHKTDVTLRGDIDWQMNPESSVSFTSNLHRFTWIDPLIFAYRSEGDEDALRDATAIMLSWIAQNPMPQKGERSETWGDKITADRAPYMAFVRNAGACEGVLSKRELGVLDASLEEQGGFLTDPANYAPTNHGLFMDLGLALLARSLPDWPQAEEWADVATERFKETLSGRVIPDEGYWLEHSTSYHFVAIAKLEQFLKATGSSDATLTALLAQMQEVGSWLVEPDGKIVQFGESDLDEADPAFAEEAADLSGMLVLRDSGLVVVRAPDSYLAVTAGFHNQTHKQSDDGSFELYDSGHRLISDSGLYSKDRGTLSAFAATNRAHSTLIVDGQDWARDEASAYGSGIVATGEGDDWFAIETRNPLLDPQGVVHNRLFVFRPGFGLVIVDRLQSEAAHSYERLFQFGPDLDASIEGDRVVLDASGFSGSLNFDSLVTPALSKGSKEPPQGLTFPAFRESEPRYTASLTTEGSTEARAATIGIGRSLGATVRTADSRGYEIALTEGESEIVLTLTRDGNEFEIQAR